MKQITLPLNPIQTMRCRWGAEVNAKITPAFFTWLVGPMEARDVEIDGQTQKSSVHIKRCRYLAESTCAGMCINLCKSPTQVRTADTCNCDCGQYSHVFMLLCTV